MSSSLATTRGSRLQPEKKQNPLFWYCIHPCSLLLCVDSCSGQHPEASSSVGDDWHQLPHEGSQRHGRLGQELWRQSGHPEGTICLPVSRYVTERVGSCCLVRFRPAHRIRSVKCAKRSHLHISQGYFLFCPLSSLVWLKMSDAASLWTQCALLPALA